ncbi:MAG: PIG-L family deacetylase [Anaerolineae bacterium]|nr:PIG-L family deacetylase [Anaerolineae bacterium]
MTASRRRTATGLHLCAMWSPLPYYDAIYLSPHLDDAVLSCGGHIFQTTQNSRSVLIVTVTAGDAPRAVSSFAQQQHQQWALDVSPIAARRAEDAAACRIVGADWLHWNLADCIYRHDPITGEPFYIGDDAIFGKVASADIGMMAQLVANITTMPACDTLFVPLAIGNHVDHQLTRISAEYVFATNNPPTQLVYYEDYPYAARPYERVAILSRSGLHPQTVALSAAAIQARFDAICAYTSQIATLFGSTEQLYNQLIHFIAATGGERHWHSA